VLPCNIEKKPLDLRDDKQTVIPATLLSELEQLSEDQRQEIAEELAINSSFWDEYEEELFL
jgi:rRNA-processing protein FCF1